MTAKTLLVAALALSTTAVAATLLARPSAAAHRKFTIAFLGEATSAPRVQAIARGGRAAAKKLGVRYILAGPRYGGPPEEYVPAFRRLLRLHPDALVTEGFSPEAGPILAKFRAAGTMLVASGSDIDAKRPLFVSSSSTVEYAQALADSLASQVHGSGEYAIARQPEQFPVANETQRLIEAYVAKVYPNMHFDGTLTGSNVDGFPEPGSVKKFMRAHPNLRGLIAVVPRCTYAVAWAIAQDHKIGKVFSADNGGGSFGDPLPGFVRTGVAQIVFDGNPVKLGYLTVWGTHYLLTGHHFKPGAYQVGGPVGLVFYYAKHQELRLGQPLTITQRNVERYANKF